MHPIRFLHVIKKSARIQPIHSFKLQEVWGKTKNAKKSGKRLQISRKEQCGSSDTLSP